MIVALALTTALAAEEHLVWEVRYLGLPVGTAEAHIVESAGGERRITAEAHSADWYRPVYSLDDHLVSLSRVSGGSQRYTATYREGDFAQDVDMRLDGPEFAVSRRQRADETWREWSDTYPGVNGPVHDGLSALVALRELPLEPGARYELPVFNGKQVVTMRVDVGERQPCAVEPGCLGMNVVVGYGKEKQEMHLQLSDDADRVPVAASFRASGARVEVTLLSRSTDD